MATGFQGIYANELPDADNLIDARCLQVLLLLDVRRQVSLRAAGRECSGNREQDDLKSQLSKHSIESMAGTNLLVGGQIADIDFVGWRVLEQLDRRDLVTFLKRRQKSTIGYQGTSALSEPSLIA